MTFVDKTSAEPYIYAVECVSVRIISPKRRGPTNLEASSKEKQLNIGHEKNYARNIKTA